LTRFAAERLLYRMGKCSARDRCILKGASLLTAWLPDPYRVTRDVDVLLSGQTDDDAIRSLIEEICAVECPEDGLRFDTSTMVIEAIRPHEEYSGKRVRFRVFLGAARINVQLDMGVGDAVAVSLVDITYPAMLPALPAPYIRAYPRELTVAEKFEAMVKLDTRNSRMKDFHDIWALAGTFPFEGTVLQRAVLACFERRGTPWAEEMPRMLTPAFYQMPDLAARWRHYLAAGAVLVPPPQQFELIGERIIHFLGPVRVSIVGGKPWESTWQPGGPWQ
jgi:hypothetical protein